MAATVYRSLHPVDLAAGLRPLPNLVDVRTVPEFNELHAPEATCVPLDRLDARTLWSSRGNLMAPVHVICRTSNRSRLAAERFLAAGIEDVVVVEGGVEAWERAGLPLVRGRRAVSLERQVRIAAGSLVALGALLGWLVHPGFFGICGMVGTGLVFAGITDTCMLGLLIARMPWNRGSSIAACAEGAAPRGP
jgi:rhodanese-related sulfurtransferase